MISVVAGMIVCPTPKSLGPEIFVEILETILPVVVSAKDSIRNIHSIQDRHAIIGILPLMVVSGSVNDVACMNYVLYLHFAPFVDYPTSHVVVGRWVAV
jgi:hypothetical protein